MKKQLVVYFSGSGNSKFLAECTANTNQLEVVEVKPAFPSTGWQFLLSLFKKSSGKKSIRASVQAADEILLFGPIWGALLVAPLRGVLELCKEYKVPVRLTLSCGSPDEKKDSKWGYNKALKEAQNLAGNLLLSAAAIPVTLGLNPMPPEKELMRYSLAKHGLTLAQKERLLQNTKGNR